MISIKFKMEAHNFQKVKNRLENLQTHLIYRKAHTNVAHRIIDNILYKITPEVTLVPVINICFYLQTNPGCGPFCVNDLR